MKVLIVDDSAIMRQLIERFVGKFNLELVGTAGDGTTALEIFHQTHPDVVTMDITMPEMDGLTCMEKMLASRPETKIIVVSALTSQDVNLRALELGAVDFIHKPFKPEELEEAFQSLND